jgi:hypothetical protein
VQFLTERESSTRTPSRALDAFSAAAGTGVSASTRGGHPATSYGGSPRPARQQVLQGRDAPYRPRRAWTARPGRTRCRTTRSGASSGPRCACRSWVEPFSRYTAGPAPSRRPHPEQNCATGTPLLRAKHRTQMPPRPRDGQVARTELCCQMALHPIRRMATQGIRVR